MDNITLRDKFLHELRIIHEHQQLPRRIYKLENETEDKGISQDRIRKYYALDNEIIDSIRAAVKKTIK